MLGTHAACRSQLLQLTQRDRAPLEQICFDTYFQYILHMVLFLNKNVISAIFLPFIILYLKAELNALYTEHQNQTKSAPGECGRAEPS